MQMNIVNFVRNRNLTVLYLLYRITKIVENAVQKKIQDDIVHDLFECTKLSWRLFFQSK